MAPEIAVPANNHSYVTPVVSEEAVVQVRLAVSPSVRLEVPLTVGVCGLTETYTNKDGSLSSPTLFRGRRSLQTFSAQNTKHALQSWPTSTYKGPSPDSTQEAQTFLSLPRTHQMPPRILHGQCSVQVKHTFQALHQHTLTCLSPNAWTPTISERSIYMHS